MSVPGAIKELEKIEIIQGIDRSYRMHYAVTAAQKTILKAFGMDANYVRLKAKEINNKLMEAEGKAG